ncbi:adenylate/guanylate cyclase domain-containing protein [Croceicoccus sp. Ery5]|uniref:adenylate/guanylate cyclase domain-containing protein n=1 Tax=Croceicoccus sp. Ery5 TaxID=1703340 RepID=UPI001E2BA614|nr:adenylate/guanylate cyclase domain-containing protein [Croceicoccus sp. Ery5]
MAWNQERAALRIQRFKETVPQGEIVVEDFARYLGERRVLKASGGLTEDKLAILRVPRNRAITTHGVHIYANLIDFNGVLEDAGVETEASHRRALEFLHTHYSACDSLIDEFEIQRVDFHGSRLHAVVLTPEGRENEPERIRKAISFAAAFRQMVERLGNDFPEFQTAVRVGIDSGPAVAIDSGKRDEPDPLFIGSPANHAAKLADGDEEGIFLSNRVQHARDQNAPTSFTALAKAVETGFLQEGVSARGQTFDADTRLAKAYIDFEAQMKRREYPEQASDAAFRFHHKEPPLKDIVFAEHPPSNAIRMPLASIFADIEGFTAYVDHAIQTGNVAEAVANLHVLRAEMAAVLREDFGGRKVRFVGDCVHGLLAEGNSRETNAMDSVRASVNAAGGIRSSFDLCKMALPGIAGLGLAIGIDFGPTPICRIGLRGAASVRTATSRATCVSENEQRRCTGTETAIGEKAYAVAPAVVRQIFGSERVISNMDYDASAMLLGTMASPYVSSVQAEPMRAHAPEPMRAHAKL